MPIIHIYKVDFRYKEGRTVASMRLEAANKKMAQATADKIAAALAPIMTAHFEKWIGFRKESPIKAFIEREPDSHP